MNYWQLDDEVIRLNNAIIEMKKEAELELERTADEAYNAGFEEGYDEGYEAGRLNE